MPVTKNNILIRNAAEEDAPLLLDLYSHYVLKTPVTFEYAVPSVAEFEDRIRRISRQYPYLTAWKNDELLGYAYAASFKNRAAYDWSAETTIYVDKAHLGEGIGRYLYQELEHYLVQQHLCNLCACIAYPNPESIAFHEALGYHTVAHFHKSGYKLDTWYDMIWMEKALNRHTIPPKPFIPYCEL